MKKRDNAYYQAQAILARRDHSVAEVTQKMRRKGFSSDDIELIIQQLQKEHLVDDRRFAERYATALVQLKPVGPRWVRAKLRQRGIEATLISQTLAQVFTPGREQELAREATARWRRLHPGEVDPAKLQRFLLSRGFTLPAGA